jgi:hypothetical protein
MAIFCPVFLTTSQSSFSSLLPVAVSPCGPTSSSHSLISITTHRGQQRSQPALPPLCTLRPMSAPIPRAFFCGGPGRLSHRRYSSPLPRRSNVGTNRAHRSKPTQNSVPSPHCSPRAVWAPLLNFALPPLELPIFPSPYSSTVAGLRPAPATRSLPL